LPAILQRIISRISEELQKLNNKRTHNPINNWAKETDSSENKGYKEGYFTPMFITTLFTIAKWWNQPRCRKTNE
jgi:hypothetical protein